MTDTPLTPEERTGWQRRLAMDFAPLFSRIRGAHNPDPGEPCAWCRLAAEQAAEAVVAMGTGIGLDGQLRGFLAALTTAEPATGEAERLRKALVRVLFSGLVPVDRGESLRVLDADASADVILAALTTNRPLSITSAEPGPAQSGPEPEQGPSLGSARCPRCGYPDQITTGTSTPFGVPNPTTQEVIPHG